MKVDSNTVAVVTGGASGLGAATARALAAKGAKVAIFDLQEEKGKAVAEEIGGVFCEVNLTDDASVEAGFDKGGLEPADFLFGVIDQQDSQHLGGPLSDRPAPLAGRPTDGRGSRGWPDYCRGWGEAQHYDPCSRNHLNL